MALAATNSISGTIFVQNKDLTWAEPSLKNKKQKMVLKSDSANIAVINQS
jgi:hypothetical protein